MAGNTIICVVAITLRYKHCDFPRKVTKDRSRGIIFRIPEQPSCFKLLIKYYIYNKMLNSLSSIREDVRRKNLFSFRHCSRKQKKKKWATWSFFWTSKRRFARRTEKSTDDDIKGKLTKILFFQDFVRNYKRLFSTEVFPYNALCKNRDGKVEIGIFHFLEKS